MLGRTGEGPRAEGIGVLVVDDNAQFRGALRDVVAATQGMTCIGEAASGEAALDAVAELSPRLVVMDKRMPGLGGIETSRRIVARHPEVVVFLVSVERPRAETLAASGAAAFLDKRNLSPRTLLELWREHAPD